MIDPTAAPEAEYASYPSLADRTCLVTGGADGIGAAAVEADAMLAPLPRALSPGWEGVADAFDAVLIRTTWDYMERQEEFAAWAERVPRLRVALSLETAPVGAGRCRYTEHTAQAQP